MRVRVINTTKHVCLAREAIVARTFRERLVGLIGRAGLTPGEALILQPCQSVHTFLMRFPLDLIFLDRAGTVRRLIAALPPGRMVPYVPAARTVVELPAGIIEATGTEAGDQVAIIPAAD